MPEMPRSWKRMIEDIKGTAKDVWEDPWQRLVKDPGEEGGGAGFRALSAIGLMLAKGGAEGLEEFMKGAKTGGGLDPYGENYNPMQAMRKTIDVMSGGVWGGSAGATAGELGTIAGVRALRRPKTLSQAVELFSEGASRQEILEKTGHFKLPVRTGLGEPLPGEATTRWGWEFSDEGAKLRMENFGKFVRKSDQVKLQMFRGNLGEGLEHTKLYENYPKMADIPLNIKIDPSAMPDAVYHNMSKGIEVTARNEREALELLAHEWQHPVSEIEGFPRGGMPEEFTKAFDVDPMTAYKMYREMGGEQLSNATAERLLMDDEMRRLIPPWAHMKNQEKWINLARGETPSVANPSVQKFFERFDKTAEGKAAAERRVMETWSPGEI